VDQLGALLREVEVGKLRFARVGLHADVNTGLGTAGLEIGEWLWRILHPKARSVPPDFTERNLTIESDAVSVWNLNGVAVAVKSESSTADSNCGRARQLEDLFKRIVRQRRGAGALVTSEHRTVQSHKKMERELAHSEKRLAAFGKLQYELSFRENAVLRQFVDAIRLQDVLETVRDRRATLAQKARAEDLRQNTETTADVQSKIEWLEVLFVSFYSIEFVHVLLEHWDQRFMVSVIAVVGLVFLGLAFVGLKPQKRHKSKSLLVIVVVLAALMVAAALLNLKSPQFVPHHAPEKKATLAPRVLRSVGGQFTVLVNQTLEPLDTGGGVAPRRFHLTQTCPQVDLMGHAFGKFFERLHFIIGPRVRFVIDHAKSTQGEARHRQGNARVGDDLQITDRRIVPIHRILSRIGNHERFVKSDCVLTKGMSERRLATRSPWFREADRALEELSVPIDE
jgi:hypothetical protein